MKYRTRTYYTDSQKVLMWERWKAGDSLQQIAQLFDRSHSSVEGILSRTGGIPPPERCRSSLALTLAEREGDLTCCGGRLLNSSDRQHPRASAIDC